MHHARVVKICAAAQAIAPAAAFGAGALGSSCIIRDDGMADSLSVGGTLPLPSSEPAHIYVVACRAGACREGPMDAEAQRYDFVALGRGAFVECALSPAGAGGDSRWALGCGFDLDSGSLGEGDCQQVWLEVRERPSWQLLVHFEHAVARNASAEGSESCGAGSSSRELHW